MVACEQGYIVVVTAYHGHTERVEGEESPIAGVDWSMPGSNRPPCRHALRRPAAGVGVRSDCRMGSAGEGQVLGSPLQQPRGEHHPRLPVRLPDGGRRGQVQVPHEADCRRPSWVLKTTLLKPSTSPPWPARRRRAAPGPPSPWPHGAGHGWSGSGSPSRPAAAAAAAGHQQRAEEAARSARWRSARRPPRQGGVVDGDVDQRARQQLPWGPTGTL